MVVEDHCLCCSRRSGKRFSVLEGDGQLRTRGGRGYVTHGRLQCTLLGGSWALLAFILPHFFASVFYIDFSLIFSRFRKGFGKDLGGQNGRKIETLAVFGNMLFETLILVEFCLSFDKIEGEKKRCFFGCFLCYFWCFV